MDIKLWMMLLMAVGHSRCITVTSNGNAPPKKTLAVVDSKAIEFGGFVPMASTQSTKKVIPSPASKAATSKTHKATGIRKSLNGTVELPPNERRRRLIPYMTYYLTANDYVEHQPNKPPLRYQQQQQQSNRGYYQQVNNNDLIYANNPYYAEEDEEFRPVLVQGIMRAPPKQQQVQQQRPIPIPVRFQQYQDSPKVKYQQQQRYKLVPYEQTPPVRVSTPIVEEQQEERDYFQVQSVPLKHEQHYEELILGPSPGVQYAIKNRVVGSPPATETGFVPIVKPTQYQSTVTSTVAPHRYQSTVAPSTTVRSSHYKSVTPAKITTLHPNYEDYVQSAAPNYGISSTDQYENGDVQQQNRLALILKSLQETNSLPQTIDSSNVDSSIRTLVKILNGLKAAQAHNTYDDQAPTVRPQVVVSTPIPFQVKSSNKQAPSLNSIPVYGQTLIKERPIVAVKDSQSVKPPRVHEYSTHELDLESPKYNNKRPEMSSQSFPASDQNELGGTPGTPGVDYPALATIPKTEFDCKSQRYKGFFGDPETNCQVWHYCDLNGGQASFLCPNGTIFSQVALTCDWWFNVKCSTTTQLYVLNERLYKYILPFSPKFPEDYSGPLVDKYLAIKYKEMEEKMKKNKKKVAKPEEPDTIEEIEIKNSGMSGALKPYEN